MGLSREHVERYKHARLSAGAAPGTVTKEMRTLQAAMNHAEQWDVIPCNPIRGVKPTRDLASKPPRLFSREELQAIYAAEIDIPKCTTQDDAELHRKYRCSWQLMANTGMRRGEALQLKWKNVGADEIRIVSSEGARTKSGKWRLIPISNGAGEALKGEKMVLPRVRQEILSRAFDRTLRRADLDGSIHCLRHIYCSHLVSAGVPLRTVQVLAGHASFTTTERYAHLAPGHLREAAKVLDL